MSVKVNLAAPLAEEIGGVRTMEVEGKTVEEVLRNLTGAYEPLQQLLWRKNGEFNPVLVVFRNKDDIRGLQGIATPVEGGDEIAIITALDGG